MLICSKIKSIFLRSIAFSARIEHSYVSRKARVWRGCKLYHSSLGDYSYVGNNSRLVYADVGKFCSIAGDVIIGMGKHTIDTISSSPIFTEARNGTKHKWIDSTITNPYDRVKVGHDVWIGARAMIMGGVNIGNGAVVGAGAIVTKDVPPYAIVAGVPARIIHYRFSPEIIERLISLNWWDLPESVIRNNIQLFQDSQIEESVSSLSFICGDYLCERE